MNSIYTSIEEILLSEGKIIISPQGKSMLPFLKEGRDSVLLKRPNNKLKKYDIVLYKSLNGRYVLHRIIKIDKSRLVICGDNSSVWERSYSPKDILAVADKVFRNGKEEKIHCPKNKIYERIWCGTFLKRVIFKIKRTIYKFIKKSDRV